MENMVATSSGLKRKGTVQLVISIRFKSLHGLGNLHIWQGTIDAERDI